MAIKAIHQFPQGFLWGCATAAHQVEGQNYNDWWRWEQKPGHIYKDQKSGRACDWWAGRYVEDFDRAVDMNNNTQRISVEWSRIEPEPDKWDDYAIQRYRDMLQALLDRNMVPMVTLHHFTNPLWIDDHQGWLWDETPTHFAKYVRKVVEALGDLCSFWCTLNEPTVYATQSYSYGRWPPGLKSSKALNRVVLNLLRGHAAAYHVIKGLQPHAQVGLAMHQISFRPRIPSFIHWPAAYIVNRFFNQAFMLALADGVARMPGSRKISVPHAANTVDWIGIQYYQSYRVGFTPFSPASFFIAERKPHDMPVGPGGWGGLHPEGIYDHIRWAAVTLKKPIYVTECGVPDHDDSIRPGYLIRSIRSVWRAVNFGLDVRGFYFWSLLDNFEWSEGFDPRFSFGLYQTNFETQERTPRGSAKLYGEICALNGISSELVERYTPELVEKMFPGAEGQTDVKLPER